MGLFAGPFIIIASITGALYGISFATENWIYKNELYTESKGAVHSLAEQIKVTNNIVGSGAKLFSVRPAARTNENTRVLYTSLDLKSSEYRTLFIDPVTLELKADILTYGSSGALPFRMKMDYLHRDLMLGQWGRWYSELAASWLWLLGLSGLVIFYQRLKAKKNHSKNSYQKLVNIHSYTGVVCLAGMLMFSATGLTWSEWAGDNVDKLRTAFNWITPSVQREIPSITNNNYDLNMFDKVLAVARKDGLSGLKIEIRPGKKNQEAWLVSEIDRSLPGKLDSVAIDPVSMQVKSKVEFQKFSLAAKLTRWGIDLHMGSLFGLLNQVLLIIFSLLIAFIVISGYLMWIKRKGWRSALPVSRSLWREFIRQPFVNKILLVMILIPVGLFLPLFLFSLIGFLVIEEVIYIVKFYKIERS